MKTTDPVRLAIALRNAPALARAIDESAPGWQERVHQGFTCWSRVLVDHRRMFLMSTLIEKGWHPPRFIVHRGRSVTPLMLAIKHGNLHALEVLLAHGADPNDLEGPNSLLACAADSFRRPLKRDAFNSMFNPVLWPDRVVDPLQKATDMLLAHGARPCPRALGIWLILGSRYPKAGWMGHADRAWTDGVRPPERLLGISVTPVSIAMRAYQAADRPFLQECLLWYMQRQPRTLSWIKHLDRTSMGVDRLEKLLGTMDQAASSPFTAEDWDSTVIQILQLWWKVPGPAKRESDRLPEIISVVKWALRNQMPYYPLFWVGSSQTLSLVEAIRPTRFKDSAGVSNHPPLLNDFLRMLWSAIPEGVESPDSPAMHDYRKEHARYWIPGPSSRRKAITATTVGEAWFGTEGWAPYKELAEALLAEIQMQDVLPPAISGKSAQHRRTSRL